ncbi:MAG: DUF3108 domain-containing protein [Verrucomicrobiota bacterium]
MRIFGLALFTLFAFGIASSAWGDSRIVFNHGDRFQYDLHWSLVKVGHAELQFRVEPMDKTGRDMIHIIFTARTSGMADKLFKVRDVIEAWIDPETGRPILYLKEQREGKTNRDVRVEFDWESMTATYSNKGVAKEPVTITEETMDPLSLINALAAKPFENSELRAHVATDGKKVVQIEAKQIKKERFKVSAGRFKADRIEVSTKELKGVFEKSPDASIFLWLSQEVPAIPLKMKSKVAVGSFHGQLTGAKIGDQVIGKLSD